MPYLPLTRKTKVAIILLCMSLSLARLFALLLFEREALKFQNIGGTVIALPTTLEFNKAILEALILGLLPYTIIEVMNRSYINSIEAHIPVFMREIAEEITSGHPFMQALEIVALRSAGPLGHEIRKALYRVRLGETLEEAFSWLRSRIPSVKLSRVLIIIEVAGRSGGRVAEVLNTSAKIVALIESFEEERKSRIKPYVSTVYIALFMLLVISFILIEIFFRPFTMVTEGPIFVSGVSIAVYESIFFYIEIIESIFGGFVAGKIAEGSIKASFKHVLLLLIMSYVSTVYVFPLLRPFLHIGFS